MTARDVPRLETEAALLAGGHSGCGRAGSCAPTATGARARSPVRPGTTLAAVAERVEPPPRERMTIGRAGYSGGLTCSTG